MSPSPQGDLFSAAAPVPAAPKSSGPAAEDAGPRTITLVDASGLIFRAYHALPPFTTSKGVPTHAVLGFTRMVLKLLRERAPTHLALCFDKDSRRGRLAIDPEYKATRAQTPADLVQQFDLIRQVATVLQLPVVDAPGWEADDVVATLVQQARAKGYRVEVITSDKDFLQLLADDVRLFDPQKATEITEADALKKFGVPPAQMRDYQALVGDAVDNVPKVPGVGPKTAAELIGKFGTVEALLARTAEIDKPKLKAAVESHADQIRRAYELVRFRDDLPLAVDVDGFARQAPLESETRELFTELEFFKLLEEMPGATPAVVEQIEVQRVDTAEALEALAAALAGCERLWLSVAFSGEPHSARPLGLGVARAEGPVAFVDVRALGSQAVGRALGPALTRPGVQLVAHDGKALLHVLEALGVSGARLGADIELWAYLLNPSRKANALADLSRERLRVELPDWAQSPGRGRPQIEDVEVGLLAASFGAQAQALQKLEPLLEAELASAELTPVARDLELPLVPILMRMERAGVAVDSKSLAEVSKQVDASVEGLLADVYRHAGREFNVGSPAQLAQVLFEELKLPVIKKGKTGPSTDHEVLEKLSESHPLPQAIIEYRNVTKLKSTYLDTLPGLVGADGRVRTTFHQAAAATGRLSSTNPNLQNIPIRTELGKQIRRAFVAEPGWVLVSADYSQIELRILAHIAGDEGLLRAFREDADVHARTAAEVFGVPLGEVTGDQRRAAKMVNYGIAYGLSSHGLSVRLNIAVDEAKSIIDRYFARYTGISGYLSQTVETARQKGYVESLFGRRRYMPDLASKNRNVAAGAERAAINMPIQGTAADLVKMAMLEVERALPAAKLNARMLLQVHDELLFEAPEAEAQAVAELARKAMSGVASLKVPLVVDVGVGRSWADAH